METFWSLFDNTIVFIAMIALLFIWPDELLKKPKIYQVSIGIFLSIMAIFTMLNSVHVGDGLYIDARYAIPFIAFLFFGNIPGLMTVITIILARIFILGGAGVPIGVTYALVQAVVMIVYKKYFFVQSKDSIGVVSLKLLLLTFVLQVVLLLTPLIFIPYDIAINAIRNNAIYLLSIYPVLVFIFSLVVGYRQEYYSNKKEALIKDKFFELILKRSPSPMIIYDNEGNVILANESWIKESGYSLDEFQTMSEWLILVSEPSFVKTYEKYTDVEQVIKDVPKAEYNITTKHQGKRVWSIERKQAGELPSGEKIFMSVAKDVTEQKEYEKNLINISYLDFLTGLYNRRYYDEVYLKSDYHCVNTFVIYGDMNNLKSLNDYYGHLMGDKAIQTCAEVLKKVFDKDATLFRFGGDEFLIITCGYTKQECIQSIERVNEELTQVDFNHVPIGISLGIAELKDGNDMNHTIMQAETRMYEYKIFESTSARSGTIDVILTMLFEKDHETERHSKRVQSICRLFGNHLNLQTSEHNLLLYAGLLHDIGKILIPTSILLNKQKLTIEEYEVVKKHSYLGHRILSGREELKEISEIVLAHHEHVDGTGYPNGLKGDEIPKIARMLNIVDAFDAMTTNRPYRPKRSYEEAVLELKACSGKQFDKELVDEFIKILPDIPRV